jgi:ribonuclease-3
VAEGSISPLEAALRYRFTDPDLLQRALTHRSFDPDAANERLEFLGDSVLELAVTAALYESSGLDEGQMTKVRVSVVDRASLAEVATGLGLGQMVLLGAGEEDAGGRYKASILADTMEAVLGAVFLDGGIDEARRVIMDHWGPMIADRVEAPGHRDYKTRLQEALATTGRAPEYRVTGEGPDHARLFTAEVLVDGRILGTGTGTSKKRAEQVAARRALEGWPEDA